MRARRSRSISHVKQRHKANKLRAHFAQLSLPEGAMDLLEKMLCMDPKKRISAIKAWQVGASVLFLGPLRLATSSIEI